METTSRRGTSALHGVRVAHPPERACLILRRVFALCSRGSIASAFAPVSRAQRWPRRMKRTLWRIYADFTQGLIRAARDLCLEEPLAVDLANAVYALDDAETGLCPSTASAN